MRDDLDKRLHEIQFGSRHPVNSLLAGEYRSCFRGRGIEFDDVREYQPGDEVRAIDWNVTARTGSPYVKQFVEERERPVFLVVDVSASFQYGSASGIKRDAAAELAGLVALAAAQNNDRVGLLLFTDEVELFLPPAKGKSHVMTLLSQLYEFKPKRRGTNLSDAMAYLDRVMRRRSILFVFSDFLDDGYQDILQRLGHYHECTAVHVTDRHETALPDVGLIRFEDAESGEQGLIDSASAAVRQDYLRITTGRLALHRQRMGAGGVGHLHVQTDDDYVERLIEYFRSRWEGRG